MDQRGRDAPATFFIPVQIGGYRYHALLKEAMWTPTTKLGIDVTDYLGNTRTVDGDLQARLPMGLYGFQRIEDRDLFCRRLNNAAAEDGAEDKICVPVTVPNLYLDEPMVTAIRYQKPDTGPVSPDTNGEPNV